MTTYKLGGPTNKQPKQLMAEQQHSSIQTTDIEFHNICCIITPNRYYFGRSNKYQEELTILAFTGVLSPAMCIAIRAAVLSPPAAFAAAALLPCTEADAASTMLKA